MNARPASVRFLDAVATAFGLVLIWFGAMKFLPFEATAVGRWLSEHLLFGGLPASTFPALTGAIGVVEIALGLGILPGVAIRLRRYAAAGIAAFFAASLTLLLTNPVWIDSMGGFPAIGAGQGVIKNLAIAALALWLWARLSMREFEARRARDLMRWGVALVLLWIGGMKFTPVEAEAIRPLIETSPFMAWLYGVFDVQGASNLIGVVEILTALCLLTLPRAPRLGAIGLAASALTFVATLSFLFTLPGWQPGHPPPVIGNTGQFLAKDLPLLLACLVLFVEEVRPRLTRSRRR
ncbi:DUF417 family protein [Rehaibacterium terrae]|jgi:uncharacterized membrane protein YkgB|uniref:Putative membrane protein YkgB n=1 Tax=Rehaibacterium terrae TaxID=1341696 RepID=A0A7W7Y0V3_9GAMM|nr:DUF417 family protein [Rehaibacterium terrae]MBB5016012.1 putative membrane protein YkgB [Rehaibacterium terrae]